VTVTGNNSSSAISGLVDSKGNKYTLDNSTGPSPAISAFRSPGATGGPTGGPTVALTTADTFTASCSGTIQFNMGLQALAVTGAGALDQSGYLSAAASTSNAVTVTTTQPGDTLVAMTVSASTGGAQSFDAPFTQIDQGTEGTLIMAAAYLLNGGAAGAVTCTARIPTAANIRQQVWAFFAPAPPPITGTGAVAAKKITLAGSGTYTPPITGAGAVAAKKIKLAGTGTVSAGITGTGALAAKKISLAGTGTYTPPITGTGAVAAKKIKLAGAGTVAPPGITGTGAIAAKKISLAGTGTVGSGPAPITGTGAVAAKKISLAGTGTVGLPPVVVPAFLPAPDLLPITWDGLSLNDGDRGDGLCTVVTNVDGWYGSPGLAGNDLARQLTNGAVYGLKTVAARVITVQGSVVASDLSARAQLNQFARDLAARAVNPNPAALLIAEDEGAGDGSTVTLSATVRADSDALAVAWLGRLYFTWQVILTAADPRLYEADSQSLTVTAAASGGQSGRIYPWRPVRAYASAAVTNAARLVNAGSIPAPVLAAYTGDLSESRLTDGINTIHLAPLSAGQQLTVNTETLATTAPGGASRASYLMAGTTPLLVPAESEVVWSLYGTGAGHVTLTWAGVYA
jgi:hypothetical protein